MTGSRRLHTERLCLVPGTADLGRPELNDRARFGRLLGAKVPSAWPPPLNDESSMTWFTEYVEENPEAVGWAAWYFLLKARRDRSTAIGNGGFKGVPDPSGTVEIGYSVLEQHQGKGLATEGVGVLIGWAFSHRRINRIIAQAIPDLRASIRVLEKQGFTFVGDGLEEGAILYKVDRGDFVKRGVTHG